MSEAEVIERIDAMVIQSLPPHLFDSWQKVKTELIKRREIEMTNEALSVEYLMKVHPEIKAVEAIGLLIFAQGHTITLQGCYGDGSIIFPMWKEHLRTLKKT